MRLHVFSVFLVTGPYKPPLAVRMYPDYNIVSSCLINSIFTPNWVSVHLAWISFSCTSRHCRSVCSWGTLACSVSVNKCNRPTSRMVFIAVTIFPERHKPPLPVRIFPGGLDSRTLHCVCYFLSLSRSQIGRQKRGARRGLRGGGSGVEMRHSLSAATFSVVGQSISLGQLFVS